MTVLALRVAAASNGVSALHGQVSRKMWQGMWPHVPEDEIPSARVLYTIVGGKIRYQKQPRPDPE